MDIRHILQDIKENMSQVITRDTELGRDLWNELLKIHPADIADFFSDINEEEFLALFIAMPKDLKLEVFEYFSDALKMSCLTFMNEQDKIELLNEIPIDKLTDLLEMLSDEDFKYYHNLLHKTSREKKVRSLLRFHPESAGGIMDIEVITLVKDFTVEKSVKILQRLRPSKDIHQQIYVTDNTHHLVGHINLEDLVLNHPNSHIASFMHENQYVAQADQDRETIAKNMVHYNLMTIPVVGAGNLFLGVIPSETLVDVLVEEAGEDVLRMSAAPLKYPYFETSFFKLLFDRCYILIILLLAESFSGTIVRAYEATLGIFLVSFIPMLISAGGNTSSQTSAMVIQGMASGEIRRANMYRFLKREFLMAFMLAVVLGLVTFARIYYSSSHVLQSAVVSLSLGLIVMLSVTLGSCVPFMLRRLNIDPAFSAGPFLATIMDILGVLIYCYMTNWILS